MPRLKIDEADGLTVADITHVRFTALPATATVADVRDWFAQGASRRLAFVADGERYLGSLTPADVAGGDGDRLAVEVAQDGPTVSPEAPATTGRDLALLTQSRRVPVLDAVGRRPTSTRPMDATQGGPSCHVACSGRMAPGRTGQTTSVVSR